MAIPAQTIRLVAAGSLPSGEVFNTGLWCTSTAVIESGPELVLALAVPQVAFNTFFAALAGVFTSGVVPTELLGYYYSAGEFGDTAEFSASVPLDNPPGTGSIRLPDQVATVVSLRTGLAGRSFRGRMYLPLNGLSLDANAQLSSSSIGLVADAAKDLVDDINAGGLEVVVMSATQTLTTPVTSIIVDSILDTQRRRRNKLVPALTATRTMA